MKNIEHEKIDAEWKLMQKIVEKLISQGASLRAIAEGREEYKWEEGYLYSEEFGEELLKALYVYDDVCKAYMATMGGNDQ